jgi:GntR family transcriptional regulator
MDTGTTSTRADWAARLSLTRDGPLPLYYQLREYLRELARDLGPDVLMPSENELIAQVAVSRATVRKAVADLVSEGVLRSVRGRGTFTAQHRFETALDRPVGFTESITSLGRRPSSRVLSVERLQSTAEPASRLGIERGDEMLVIERLRLIDGEPAMLERMHLPATLVPSLTDGKLEGSIYELLELEYGLFPARGTETIFSINADERLARLLGTEAGSALLTTIRTTQTHAGTPLEYTLRHARGDICSFVVALNEGSALLMSPAA